MFSPKNNLSKIIHRPEKGNSGGFLMDVENAKMELGYKPVYDCRKLFENYKQEMQLNRFKDIRMID